jgi:hypothetical protein
VVKAGTQILILALLASSLRGEAAGPALLSPLPPGTPSLRDTVYVGASVGVVGSDSADVQALVPNAAVGDAYGSLVLLKLGFLSESGFCLEGAYSFGPYRQYQFDYVQEQDAYALSESTLSIEPGYRVVLGSMGILGAGLAFGWSRDALLFSVTGSQENFSQSLTGSNISYAPELKLSLVFGRLGLDLDGGYLSSQSGIMKDMSGAPHPVPNVISGGSSSWNMDNSGMFLRLGMVLYWEAPLRPAKRA